jgi:hypothetical protein
MPAYLSLTSRTDQVCGFAECDHVPCWGSCILRAKNPNARDGSLLDYWRPSRLRYAIGSASRRHPSRAEAKSLPGEATRLARPGGHCLPSGALRWRFLRYCSSPLASVTKGDSASRSHVCAIANSMACDIGLVVLVSTAKHASA